MRMYEVYSYDFLDNSQLLSVNKNMGTKIWHTKSYKPQILRKQLVNMPYLHCHVKGVTNEADTGIN